MDKKIQKVLFRGYAPDPAEWRRTWKRFWIDKKQLYTKYSYWRFILATPAYLVIYLGQLLTKTDKPAPEWLIGVHKKGTPAYNALHNDTKQWIDDNTPAYMTIDYKAIKQFIDSLPQQEKDELFQLRKEIDEHPVKPEISFPQPTGFYQDGEYPIGIDKVFDFLKRKQ